MSPLIEVALSVRALNTSMALNLLKCASFSRANAADFLLFLFRFFFSSPCTCPEASSSEGEASRWKTSIVLAAEHMGSLGSAGEREDWREGGADQLSSASKDKWLALLNGKTSVSGSRETQQSGGGVER